MGYQPKTCRVCGKTFKPVGPHESCCSKECSRELAHRRDDAKNAARAAARAWKIRHGLIADHPMMTCPGCGKAFARMRRTQVYCSKACRLESQIAASAARKAEYAEDAARGLTRAQAKEVRRLMALPANERWPGSKNWTPAQRHFAQAIDERQETEGRLIDHMATDSRGRGW